MRRTALGAALVVVWLLLWDHPSWGLLVSGVAVVAIMLVALRPSASDPADRLIVRPAAVARLLVWFTWQFILSNVYVARAVLFPSRWVRAGVIRVDLHTDSPTLVALVSNATAVTPGMQPVDTESDLGAISIHVLYLTSVKDTQAVIWRLEERIRRAFDPKWQPAPAGPGRDEVSS